MAFACCELAAAGTFFFLPFALGAFAGAAVCFLGAGITLSWIVFIAVSGIAFSGMWKLGRRLERADGEQEGVGATRWVGQVARVLVEIEAGGIGLVRLDREEWRAESLTGEPISKGSTVVVTQVAGTRLVVVPVDGPVDEMSLPDLDGSRLTKSSIDRTQFEQPHSEGDS